MNALETLAAICALVLTMIVAIGLHTLQMWLERCDIDRH
jgi:hypothetical protein